ncbi:molybdopterin-synthase adenylyltransferase MoeB [Roseivivax sediminis]|uniref:Molybdopterin-synthase adenylyltransferase n=1 Tax=Roseivivax sediminis TaxID=936889 RepID=A0A1I1WBR6_9RHOB|nr:molybdopterin-synthase adenylyltransferase MoeB [Roseivivax sediminis]SFD91838.1 adenylyltransferase and sulfurtransferase [Roseivivax sediminis]
MDGSAPPTMPELTQDETRRYGRQLVLSQIGPDGQRRLKGARVLVVGSGGLGSPVLLYLAAAGIGHLGIVDFDIVDMSNLHRQVLFTDADVDRSKTESAAERLRAQNPHLSFAVHEARIDADNAAGLVSGHDVVVDGTDNFAARYVINDACVRAGVPNVSASILRFEAQVSVFDPARGGPCYRCVFPAPPPAGLAPSCAEAGVVGVLPGIAGTLQANEVIKLVCGIGTPLAGRLLTFDALDARFRTFEVARDRGCVACGDAADPARPLGLNPEAAPATCHAAAIPEMTVEALSRSLAEGTAPLLVDVRGEAERGIAAIPGCTAMPLDTIEIAADALPTGRTILCICHKGGRSITAARTLRELGFDDVASLAGGVDAWAARIDPSVARY